MPGHRRLVKGNVLKASRAVSEDNIVEYLPEDLSSEGWETMGLNVVLDQNF